MKGWSRPVPRRKRPTLPELEVATPLGHCAISGKLRWSRRADARAHLRRLKAAGDRNARALATYRCECSSWHVGHRAKGAAA